MRTENHDLKLWINRLASKTWKRIGAASRLASSMTWNTWSVTGVHVADPVTFPTYASTVTSSDGESPFFDIVRLTDRELDYPRDRDFS